MNLVLMGPPGCGKGTQAARVADARHVPVIATGDMLRRTALAATSMGRAVKSIIESGELVDDEMMIEILSDRIAQADALAGFVLDGFPRTVNQGLALDVLMEQRGPVIVVEIAVPPDVLVKRLSERMICARCGTIVAAGTREARQCACGGTLRVRADDRESVVRERLRVYERATRPLVDFYRKRSTFRVVDGQLAPERVTEQIEIAIDRACENVSA